ncbi:hypothetical protein [Paraburkholderia sp. MM5384-R2]|uniref:hypothetical protein n=1 Tax=Paraburkholderia sp. MM5384-R2 TaxID=2723097 RepID=UPI00161690E3|nr:hypothetical protein [Paraburkholderia sp. MM5384-R2]MBB5496885.1 hypothetical protein [Paraburkholderia sp. MM5384-R2]
MAQVASYQVPAHPSGLDMRVQLNAIILALIGDNAGPTEPAQTFPGMWWGDTSANRLRRRNNVNDAWVDIGPLHDPLADIRQLVYDTAANKVDRRGDFMSGSLFMRGVPLYWQNAAATANFGYINSYGEPGGNPSGIGFVDNLLTNWNFQVNNNGTVSCRSTLTVNSGGATLWGRVNFRQAGAGGEYGMYSADGTVMFMRGTAGGGGMEIINNDYNLILFRFTNGAVLQFPTNGGFINPDCNMWLPWRNQYLSDALAGVDQIGNKADRYANCPHNSDVIDIGGVVPGMDGLMQLGSPWVMVGIATSQYNSAIQVRAVYLRNN